MAVPVVEADWTSDSSGTSRNGITVTRPAGLTTGDVSVVIGINEDAVASTGTWDAKSGWNLIVNIGDTATDAKLGIYWKAYDGTEGATESFTTNVDAPIGDGGEHGGWWLRISGADTTTPIHKTGTALLNTASSSHAITGVTTTLADCLCLYALAFDGADGFPFPVTGTGWSRIDQIQNGTGANESSGCIGQRDLATAGASGTATVSSTVSDGCAAIQIAIAPAAGGATVAPLAVHHLNQMAS